MGLEKRGGQIATGKCGVERVNYRSKDEGMNLSIS